MAKQPGIWLDIPDEWFEEVLEMTYPAVEEAGNAVASSITGVDTTVTMKRDYEGRPVAMVALAEAKGAAMQAKHGTLTKAAANQGLSVVRYPPR